LDAVGLGAVSQRMAELHARIALLDARPAPAVGAPAFSQVLGAALQRTGAAGPASAAGHVHAEPPPELLRYGNGRVPPTALAEIGVGGHRMWAPAAGGFQRLAAAAAAEGITIGVTDSYRGYDEQVDLARRKGLYSQGGLAAEPGTSDHGWGLSLDLDLDDRAQAWMRANAGRHGFVEDVPREPWHWTYMGGR